jgi:hypothetical protein
MVHQIKSLLAVTQKSTGHYFPTVHTLHLTRLVNNKVKSSHITLVHTYRRWDYNEHHPLADQRIKMQVHQTLAIVPLPRIHHRLSYLVIRGL